MKRKVVIVADSSANLFQTDYAGFVPVPLKILTDTREYVDDEALDTSGMKVFLLTDCLINKGREDINQYRRGSFEQLLDYIHKNL